MARKTQKLINYHTGDLASMPNAFEVDYGEIVVRHNEQQPELLIKVSESEFGVIPGSGAVASAISVAAESLQNKIEAVDGRVNTVSGDLNTFKTYVANTYETKTGVTNAITAAKDSVYSSATTAAFADATAKANKAKDDAITAAAASATTLLGLVDAVDDRVDIVSGDLNTFKTDVADTYETKDNVTTAITAAKDSVYSSATTAAAADAKEKADAAQTAAINAAAASADTLNTSIETVDGKVEALSGNVETAIQNLKTGLTETINTQVARAYRYFGSCAYAQLPASGSVIGEVWNVTDAHDKFPAGTNYAWNGTEWDALGGSVDLSPYALKTEVTGATKTLQNNIDAANLRIDTVSGDLNTFKTDVADTYETKDNVTTAITAAKDSVYSSATTAAFADAQEKANTAKSEAIAAAAASADTLNTSIETVDGRVDTVSGDLNTFKTDVADTYETKDNVTTAITAAKDSVYSSATTAAAADAKSKADAAEAAAIAAAAASANTLQNNIDTVNSSVTGLSASTVTIQGIANTAIQTASIVDSATCKVSVEKEGTELQFNFSNLVIDCGDF